MLSLFHHLWIEFEQLGSYIYSIEKSNNQCDEQNITFCVSSVEEIEKCLDLAKVAIVRKVGPFIRCVGKFTKEECIDEVRMQKADVVNLSPFDFYNSSRLVSQFENHNTIIIVLASLY